MDAAWNEILDWIMEQKKRDIVEKMCEIRIKHVV